MWEDPRSGMDPEEESDEGQAQDVAPRKGGLQEGVVRTRKDQSRFDLGLAGVDELKDLGLGQSGLAGQMAGRQDYPASSQMEEKLLHARKQVKDLMRKIQEFETPILEDREACKLMVLDLKSLQSLLWAPCRTDEIPQVVAYKVREVLRVLDKYSDVRRRANAARRKDKSAQRQRSSPQEPLVGRANARYADLNPVVGLAGVRVRVAALNSEDRRKHLTPPEEVTEKKGTAQEQEVAHMINVIETATGADKLYGGARPKTPFSTSTPLMGYSNLSGQQRRQTGQGATRGYDRTGFDPWNDYRESKAVCGAPGGDGGDPGSDDSRDRSPRPPRDRGRRERPPMGSGRDESATSAVPEMQEAFKAMTDLARTMARNTSLQSAPPYRNRATTEFEREFIRAIPYFDGKVKDDFFEWISRIEKAADILDDRERYSEQQLAILKAKGSVYTALTNFKRDSPWPEVKRKLQREFSKLTTSAHARENLLNRTQGVTETLDEYVNDYYKLVQTVEGVNPQKCTSHTLIYNFIKGVQDEELKKKASRRLADFQTLYEAGNFCQRREVAYKMQEVTMNSIVRPPTIFEVNQAKGPQTVPKGRPMAPSPREGLPPWAQNQLKIREQQQRRNFNPKWRGVYQAQGGQPFRVNPKTDYDGAQVQPELALFRFAHRWKDVDCFECGKKGHPKTVCRNTELVKKMDEIRRVCKMTPEEKVGLVQNFQLSYEVDKGSAIRAMKDLLGPSSIAKIINGQKRINPREGGQNQTDKGQMAVNELQGAGVVEALDWATCQAEADLLVEEETNQLMQILAGDLEGYDDNLYDSSDEAELETEGVGNHQVCMIRVGKMIPASDWYLEGAREEQAIHESRLEQGRIERAIVMGDPILDPEGAEEKPGPEPKSEESGSDTESERTLSGEDQDEGDVEKNTPSGKRKLEEPEVPEVKRREAPVGLTRMTKWVDSPPLENLVPVTQLRDILPIEIPEVVRDLIPCETKPLTLQTERERTDSSQDKRPEILREEDPLERERDYDSTPIPLLEDEFLEFLEYVAERERAQAISGAAVEDHSYSKTQNPDLSEKVDPKSEVAEPEEKPESLLAMLLEPSSEIAEVVCMERPPLEAPVRKKAGGSGEEGEKGTPRASGSSEKQDFPLPSGGYPMTPEDHAGLHKKAMLERNRGYLTGNEGRPIYISLEGNVGAGKSTVLRKLGGDLRKVEEPYEVFTKWGRHNPLLLSCQDPSRNLPLAQLHIIQSSFRWYQQVTERFAEAKYGSQPIYLSERSVCSTEVFVRALHRMGRLSDFSKDYLLAVIMDLGRQSYPQLYPDYVIYLDVDPAVCQERMMFRNTDTDFSLGSEYLRIMKEVHDEYFHRQPKVIEIKVTAGMTVVNVMELVTAAIRKAFFYHICIPDSAVPDGPFPTPFPRFCEESSFPETGWFAGESLWTNPSLWIDTTHRQEHMWENPDGRRGASRENHLPQQGNDTPGASGGLYALASVSAAQSYEPPMGHSMGPMSTAVREAREQAEGLDDDEDGYEVPRINREVTRLNMIQTHRWSQDHYDSDEGEPPDPDWWDSEEEIGDQEVEISSSKEGQNTSTPGTRGREALEASFGSLGIVEEDQRGKRKKGPQPRTINQRGSSRCGMLCCCVGKTGDLQEELWDMWPPESEETRESQQKEGLIEGNAWIKTQDSRILVDPETTVYHVPPTRWIGFDYEEKDGIFTEILAEPLGDENAELPALKLTFKKSDRFEQFGERPQMSNLSSFQQNREPLTVGSEPPTQPDLLQSNELAGVHQALGSSYESSNSEGTPLDTKEKRKRRKKRRPRCVTESVEEPADQEADVVEPVAGTSNSSTPKKKGKPKTVAFSLSQITIDTEQLESIPEEEAAGVIAEVRQPPTLEPLAQSDPEPTRKTVTKRIKRSNVSRFPAQVNGMDTQALYDTGADTSCISMDLFKSMNPSPTLLATTHTAYSASGEDLGARGMSLVTLVLGTEEFRHKFLVLEHLRTPVIIGNDLQQKYNMGQSWCNGRMTLTKGNGTDKPVTVVNELRKGGDHVFPLTMVSRLMVPPRMCLTALVKIGKDPGEQLRGIYRTEANEKFQEQRGLLTFPMTYSIYGERKARNVVSKEDQIPFLLVNLNTYPVVLQAGTLVGDLVRMPYDWILNPTPKVIRHMEKASIQSKKKTCDPADGMMISPEQAPRAECPLRKKQKIDPQIQRRAAGVD